MVVERGQEACPLDLEAVEEAEVADMGFGQLMQALVDTEGDMNVLAFLDLVLDSADYLPDLLKFTFQLVILREEGFCLFCELLLVVIHLRVLGDFEFFPKIVCYCLKESEPVCVDEFFKLMMVFRCHHFSEFAPESEDQGIQILHILSLILGRIHCFVVLFQRIHEGEPCIGIEAVLFQSISALAEFHYSCRGMNLGLEV